MKFRLCPDKHQEMWRVPDLPASFGYTIRFAWCVMKMISSLESVSQNKYMSVDHLSTIKNAISNLSR